MHRVVERLPVGFYVCYLPAADQGHVSFKPPLPLPGEPPGGGGRVTDNKKKPGPGEVISFWIE